MRPIDADALIEKCGDWYVEEGTESGFIGTLESLLATEPTVQSEPEWILTSEKLPEDKAWRTNYLATVTCDTWKYPKTMCVEWENTTVRGKEVSRWLWNGKLFPSVWEIVAYMPLPEAYKGETK